jgi:hypothetical protein
MRGARQQPYRKEVVPDRTDAAVLAQSKAITKEAGHPPEKALWPASIPNHQGRDELMITERDKSYDLSCHSSLRLSFIDMKGAELFTFEHVRDWSHEDCEVHFDASAHKGSPYTHLTILQPKQMDRDGESHADRIPIYDEQGKRRQLNIILTGKKGVKLFEIELCEEGGDDLARFTTFDKKGRIASVFFIKEED